MAETLDFDVVHYYDIKAVRIPLDVSIIYNGKTSEFVAKIDTGSTFCIFRRSHGELLDLEIEEGNPI